MQTTGQKETITRLWITDKVIDGFVMSKLGSFETTLLGRQPFAGLDEWPADGQLRLFCQRKQVVEVVREVLCGAQAEVISRVIGTQRSLRALINTAYIERFNATF